MTEHAISLLGVVVSTAAAMFSAWQAHGAKVQATASKIQADAARVQADLAGAELAKLRLSETEEKAHEEWTHSMVKELRKSETDLAVVVPGAALHADWGVARGFLEDASTSHGRAVRLPIAERLLRPGSPEAKLREMRTEILTSCAGAPSAFHSLDPGQGNPQEWSRRLAIAEQLEEEGLITVSIAGDRSVAMVRITSRGLLSLQ